MVYYKDNYSMDIWKKYVFYCYGGSSILVNIDQIVFVADVAEFFHNLADFQI